MISQFRHPSKMELKVLLATAGGETEKAVGADFGISPKTVASHKQNVYQKLGLHCLFDVVEWAILYYMGCEAIPFRKRAKCGCAYVSADHCHRSKVVRGQVKVWDGVCECYCHDQLNTEFMHKAILKNYERTH